MRSKEIWEQLQIGHGAEQVGATGSTLFIQLCMSGAVRELQKNFTAQKDVQNEMNMAQVMEAVDGELVTQHPKSTGNDEYPF